MEITPSPYLNSSPKSLTPQPSPTLELVQYLENIAETDQPQEIVDIGVKETSAVTALSFVEASLDEAIKDAYIISSIGSSDAKAQIVDHDPDKYVSGEDAQFFFVNGINTSESDAEYTALRLSTLIGKDIESVYSKALGVVDDITLAHKLDISNKSQANPIEKNSDLTRKLVESLVNQGKNVKIIAHSRGSAEVASALWEFRTGVSQILSSEKTNQLLAKVEVVTMGALAVSSDFPSDVKLTNITNPFDLVPKLSPSAQMRQRLSQIEQLKEHPEAGNIIAQTSSPQNINSGYLGKASTLAKLGKLSLSLHVFQYQQHFVDTGSSSYLGQKAVQGFFSKLAD